MAPTFISVIYSDRGYVHMAKRTYPITSIVLIEPHGDNKTYFTVSIPGSNNESFFVNENYEDVLLKLETETKVPLTYMRKILSLTYYL